MIKSSRHFQADWVIPVDQPPIKNGVVATHEGLIVGVGKPDDLHLSSESEVVHLTNSAIIPGLINSHTHLEFSDLDQPLGQQGMAFTDWIRQVVAFRNETISNKHVAIRQGLDEAFETGTWVVGDIATEPFDPKAYVKKDPNQLVFHFHEQLGRSEGILDEKRDQLEHLLSIETAHASPHAPYSTHPDLVRQICRLAAAKDRMVAMHLAETKAELELLDSKTGEFVDLLKDFGVWDPESFDPSVSISDLLKVLATAPNALVVHGNYLSKLELEFIASNREKMSIVYCPRTHDYFGHAEYPMGEITDWKIPLLAGTDSRASNPDLNLWSELVMVAKKFDWMDKQFILKMATENPAVVMGIEDEYGSIAVGKKAALSLLSHPNASAPSEEWMFDPSTKCRPISSFSSQEA